jgi:hypothetical protein
MIDLKGNEKDQLIQVTLAQAKYFLGEANEFFPFATIIDRDYEIKPTGIYFGEEYPSSVSVLQALEKNLLDGISSGIYNSGAIGLDVFVTSPDNIKKTGVEIRLYINGMCEKVYFLYNKVGQEYYFEADPNLH